MAIQFRRASICYVACALASCSWPIDDSGIARPPVDDDGDGLTSMEDCDDADASVGLPDPWYADADGDGFGDPSTIVNACAAPSGTVGDASDCDDTRADVNPVADEVCDGVDNDCDALVDDLDPDVDLSTGSAWLPDADGDGYGAPPGAISACDAPPGYGAALDCDDANADVNPRAEELCNGVDDDCDAQVDDDDDDLADGALYYIDDDRDGFGDDALPAHRVCTPGPEDALVGGDCDDRSSTSYPGALEICDGKDNDCDGDGSDVGVATWIDVTASPYTRRDAVADLAGGTYGAPTIIASEEALSLCEGTWYISYTALTAVVDFGYKSFTVRATVSSPDPARTVITTGTDDLAFDVGSVHTDETTGWGAPSVIDSGGARAEDVTVDHMQYLNNRGPLVCGCDVIRDATFSGNTNGALVGARYVYSSVFEDNHTSAGGAAIDMVPVDGAALLSIEDSEFRRNTSDSDGGAVRIYRTGSEGERWDDVSPYFRLLRNTFEDNEAGGHGGAFFFDGGAPPDSLESWAEASDNTFTGNVAGGSGGAMFVQGGELQSGGSIENNTFRGNTAPVDGGALFVGPGWPVTTSDNEVLDNAAGGRGGGAFVTQQELVATMVGDAFTGNAAAEGGALYTFRDAPYTTPLRLTDLTFATNTPDDYVAQCFADPPVSVTTPYVKSTALCP